MRTYSRSDWEAAQASWAGFSGEWRELRHLMAMQGAIFAPSGTALDSWEDDSPSQRAVLIRAIREQPSLLMRCARGARSWQHLVDRLFSARDDWREEAALREAGALAARRADRELDRRAMRRLSDVLATIADSGTPR